MWAHRGGELGRDLLRLIGHPELRDFQCLVVRLQHACQHADEGGLSCPILSQHDDDLRVCEVALLHMQLEISLQKGQNL